MAKTVALEDIGAPADRSRVLALVASLPFEGQMFSTTQRARMRAELVDDWCADWLFSIVRDRLGSPHEWPVSLGLHAATQGMEGWSFVGVSPRFTVYRYGRGGALAVHRDEERQLGAQRWTALSALVYLPTGEPAVGGETFVDAEPFVPEPWSLVVFAHHSWHHAAEVISGSKLVLRGDVMIAAGE